MLITLIETDFHDTIVITSDGDDTAAINRAVVTELHRLFGDLLGAEEGPWFLTEHPYPQDLSNAAELDTWVTAVRENLFHPWVALVTPEDHIRTC